MDRLGTWVCAYLRSSRRVQTCLKVSKSSLLGAEEAIMSSNLRCFSVAVNLKIGADSL